jgi:NAD(P)-dependent dehydrogenase (short-subunit alcohol dehydrogenase family)
MKRMKKIVVIDGQGGGIGRALIEQLKPGLSGASVIAVGTNSLATAAMLKAGADAGATGENAVVFNCADADVIAGPVGIVLANSMLGEITPLMAKAAGESRAEKVLIPVQRCRAIVAGVQEAPIAKYIEDAARIVRTLVMT